MNCRNDGMFFTQQRNERFKMKSITHRKIAGLTGLALALGFLAMQPNSALAQGKGSGRGGAASLRGRVQPVQAVQSQHQHHQHAKVSCAKCQDTTITVRDLEPRGGGGRALMAQGVPTKTVAKHLCEGCQVSWTVKGHGKQKKSVATHTCTMSGEESGICCKVKS